MVVGEIDGAHCVGGFRVEDVRHKCELVVGEVQILSLGVVTHEIAFCIAWKVAEFVVVDNQLHERMVFSEWSGE